MADRAARTLPDVAAVYAGVREAQSAIFHSTLCGRQGRLTGVISLNKTPGARHLKLSFVRVAASSTQNAVDE